MTILKIPFILLGILLLLLLAAALLLLFVPIRYQASAEKTEKLSASARITWLLHLLSVSIEYREGKPQICVKICGYTVIGEKKKKTRSRKKDAGGKKALPEEDTEKTEPCVPPDDEAASPDGKTASPEEEATSPDGKTAPPEEESSSSGTSIPPEDKPVDESQDKPVDKSEEEPGNEPSSPGDEPEEGPVDEPQEEQPRAGIFGRLREFFEKIKNSFRLFLEKIRNIRQSIEKLKSRLEYYKKLWYDVHTQEALQHVKKEIRYLLRHYFPKKIEGNVLFGLDDPADTGQLLGILSILQVAAGNRIIVEADFTKPVLEGRIFLKGHIRACHMVKTVLALLLDKHVRITIKRIRRLLGSRS
ncbi:DUF2953 domain-containing protein [Marvinbryantia formatexigens]|uniref:DUF2953 domain-containing protein n=1 Tax=Marvinbryantia formatexigens TaxID=168384 RepID=UPI0002FD69EC|nr:DUF2953 domain-containing protein [Marvinbryantia formatexigens]